MDAYGGFVERYDFSFGLFGEHAPQVVEFFRQLFAQNDVHTVLDCACGTGRHFPLFHALSCEASGSDISGSMLKQARQNVLLLGLDFPLHLADFRQLSGHFRKQYDAVVCLAAIGFMPGESEFLTAFKSMALILHPRGILILTAMPTDRQWKEKPRFILNSNRWNFTWLFAIDYFEDKTSYNILDIFRSGKASDLKVWSAELYPLLRDDQERFLLHTCKEHR